MIFILALLAAVLSFTLPIFALNIFDRVIPSGNTDTLIVLGSIAVVLLLAYALVEQLRAQIGMETKINPKSFDAPFVPMFLFALYAMDDRLMFLGVGLILISLLGYLASNYIKALLARFHVGLSYIVMFSASTWLMVLGEVSTGVIVASGFISQRMTLIGGFPRVVKIKWSRALSYYFATIAITIISVGFIFQYKITDALTVEGFAKSGNWEISTPEQRKGQILVVKGQVINQGDIIATLDVSKEQANLVADQRHLEALNTDIERVRKAANDGVIASTELINRQHRLLEVEANISILEQIIENSIIRSPIDATVLQVKNANVLGPEPFLTLVPGDAAIIEAMVKQARIDLVDVGQVVRLMIDDQEIKGKVLMVSADQLDGDFVVTIEPETTIKTGRIVNVYWPGEIKAVWRWIAEPIQKIIRSGFA